MHPGWKREIKGKKREGGRERERWRERQSEGQRDEQRDKKGRRAGRGMEGGGREEERVRDINENYMILLMLPELQESRF